jgi:hypothetical protein
MTRDLILDAEDEIKAWESGEKSLFVWGRINYEDAFGKPRFTAFRYVMPKEGTGPEGGKFRTCREGNEAT